MLVACIPQPSIKRRRHDAVDEEDVVVHVDVPGDVMLMLYSILGAVNEWAEGRAWREQIRIRSRSALALSSTCKLSRATLVQTGVSTADSRLWDEILARAMTDVQPLVRGGAGSRARKGEVLYPLIQHMRQERASTVLLASLKCADEEVAYHCAGPCCANARISTNRKLTKQKRKVADYHGRPAEIVAVASSVREFAACADEAVCFAHTCYGRKRGASGATHALTKFRLENRSVVVCAQQLNMAHRGLDVLWMAAAPGGEAVAYIAYDSDAPASMQPGPVVGVWAPCDGNSHRRIYVGAEAVLSSDAALLQTSAYSERLPVRFPQQLWWRSRAPGESAVLVVAWSTTLVHPIGHDSLEGDFVLPSRLERYYMALHEITGLDGSRNEPLVSSFESMEGPFKGRLIQCSASLDGRRIAALCRADRTSAEEPVQKCSVHYQGLLLDLPTRDASWPAPQGPMTVGMSPAGDCIVCVLETDDTTVTAQVFDLDEQARYQLVCNQALTDCMGCDRVAQHHAAPYSPPLADIVKLRYAISFSHCGRYATVFDQRARWGAPMTGYAAAILDVGNRRRSANLPCHPLCYCECDDEYTLRSIACTPMRAVQWSENQAWVMSHRGLLAASL